MESCTWPRSRILKYYYYYIGLFLLWRYIVNTEHQYQNILNVGTGTGIWAMYVRWTSWLHLHTLSNNSFHSKMADKYPSARVIGVNLSPIQPPFIPPNCIFKINNVTLPWTYTSDQFEFIHVCELYGSIPDWDKFFQQCWHCLKPSRYIEVTEHSAQPISDDRTVGPDHFY